MKSHACPRKLLVYILAPIWVIEKKELGIFMALVEVKVDAVEAVEAQEVIMAPKILIFLSK